MYILCKICCMECYRVGGLAHKVGCTVLLSIEILLLYPVIPSL